MTSPNNSLEEREKVTDILFRFWNLYTVRENSDQRDEIIEKTVDEIQALLHSEIERVTKERDKELRELKLEQIPQGIVAHGVLIFQEDEHDNYMRKIFKILSRLSNQ